MRGDWLVAGERESSAVRFVPERLEHARVPAPITVLHLEEEQRDEERRRQRPAARERTLATAWIPRRRGRDQGLDGVRECSNGEARGVRSR